MHLEDDEIRLAIAGLKVAIGVCGRVAGDAVTSYAVNRLGQLVARMQQFIEDQEAEKGTDDAS